MRRVHAIAESAGAAIVARPVKKPVMLTRSGVSIHLLEPAVAAIRPNDLAEHLAKANRWAGATALPFTVAQHSIMVATYCPQAIQPYAILHDAHEAYIGDIITPAARALDALLPGARAALADLKARLDFAIHARFGLAWPLPRAVAMAVHHADMVAQATELRDLFDPSAVDPALPPAHHNRIRPMPWADAAHAFANRLKAYGLE